MDSGPQWQGTVSSAFDGRGPGKSEKSLTGSETGRDAGIALFSGEMSMIGSDILGYAGRDATSVLSGCWEQSVVGSEILG